MAQQLEPGSRLSQAVCLRYVMRHPVAFREYFVPKVTRLGYWHRHAISPIVLAMDQHHTALYAGRGVGKSFAILEPDIPRRALARPGEETLLTSFRKVHVGDRMERVIDYFEMIPLFRMYLPKTGDIRRSPVYEIKTRTQHAIFGISVGDDPEARMAQGKHATTIFIEEAHQYPLRAYMKLDGAKHTRGCTEIMVGVPDGRVDTPFRKADEHYRQFEAHRFHHSKRYDPFFNQEMKRSSADKFGGEDSDLFKQEVDAEWGHPVFSAWDLESIYACMVEPQQLPVVVIEVSGKRYRERGLGPEVVLAELPRGRFGGRIKIAMDVGYSQPSEVLVLEHWKDRWWLIARVRLVNRMEHDDQAAIVGAMGAYYDAEEIGVDTTEGEGRAIAAELEKDPRWGARDGEPSRIIRYNASEMHVAEYVRKEDGSGEVVEVKENSRDVGTRVLRLMFKRREFALPKDDEIPGEFNQEVEARGKDGKTRVITPSTVHCSDAFRVFAFMLFLQHPPRPPSSEEVSDFVLPEWGEGIAPVWVGSRALF